MSFTAIVSRAIIALIVSACAVHARDASLERESARPDPLALALPHLREGDLIFIRTPNALYREITETSRSWESHVGILFRDACGAWTVAESTMPFSKFTPLPKLLTHSKHGRFVIRRLRGGLTPEEAGRLRAAATRRMGILYHLGFKYDSPRLFCSKLVYDSYLEATSRKIGHIETFRDMLATNPSAPLPFWRIWFFGRVPWDRRTITTTSELRSPLLVTVFDSEKPVR
ncbi:MAG: YiiX/YebB-like N1pC/P60 family cysteine hydrolase [Chthoniobacteraceae bacterium]